MSSSGYRVAFVLSGGASLGAVQVGMLRALCERRIVPDLIVGTSVGAINGAFIASRPQTPATADEFAESAAGQVFPLRPFIGLLGFVVRSCPTANEALSRRRSRAAGVLSRAALCGDALWLPRVRRLSTMTAQATTTHSS